MQKGGVSLQMVDRVRVEQLIRGAVESDLLLLQLRLRERKNHPPTFLTLLNEVREAEENEVARQKIKATVKCVQSQDEGKLIFSVVVKSRNQGSENQASTGVPKCVSCFCDAGVWVYFFKDTC